MITLEEVLRDGAELKHWDRTLIFNRGNKKFEIEFDFVGYRIKTKQYETLVGAMTEFKMEKKFITFENDKDFLEAI
jgi:pyrimidine operon attenuation protein/uracil phosphoribosyltransferase